MVDLLVGILLLAIGFFVGAICGRGVKFDKIDSARREVAEAMSAVEQAKEEAEKNKLVSRAKAQRLAEKWIRQNGCYRCNERLKGYADLDDPLG